MCQREVFVFIIISLHDWANFLIGFFGTRILYFVHKIGVEDLCIAQDFLRGNIFVRGDSFLYTARDFLIRGDVFVGGDSFLGRGCLFCRKYLCQGCWYWGCLYCGYLCRESLYRGCLYWQYLCRRWLYRSCFWRRYLRRKCPCCWALRNAPAILLNLRSRRRWIENPSKDRLMLIWLELRFICILRSVCRLISGCQLMHVCRLLWWSLVSHVLILLCPLSSRIKLRITSGVEMGDASKLLFAFAGGSG